MARLVLTDAYVVLASTDISQYVTSVTLSTTLDVVETTSFGSSSRTRVAGLRDNQITLEFNQDFASGALETLIYPSDATTKIGTAVAMEIRPTSGSASTTNPKYTFNALITEWQSVSGSIGELASVSVTWPISGAITKATA
jgi:hypothetical protein